MTETQANKIKRERSAAYPAIALSEAIECSGKLIAAYGKSPFSRENAVQGIGYKTVTGISASKVAALVHFGLLKRDGNAYRNSELAERILHFTSDDDKQGAIMEAAIAPKLFRTLIRNLQGQALPTQLGNVLVRDHAISRKVSEGAAETFRTSIEFAGLYENGIIKEGIVSKEEQDDDQNIALRQQSTQSPGARVSPIRRPVIRGPEAEIFSGKQSLPLPSGVIVTYPIELAYLFGMGKFAKQLADLDAAVAQAKDDSNHGKTNTDTPSE